ncbi:hypothetical protein BS47DRAFT_845444 [Hydnum rufescens UP504]|uniref:Uncharacterized protein n=1 Tax=Hydnum rufescens UP504 TaxID=1448309 RepID=A0A9P6DLH6_9AGAM|nr:hypothetical protein BS47DRAFT_845444 [Hydnum rufescens UP504]
MPQWLIRLVLRKMIRTSWKPIFKSLRSKLRSSLLSAFEITLHSTLEDFRVSTLRTILWTDDVGDAMRDASQPNLMATILDALAKTLSSTRLRREDADSFQSLAATFAHRDFLDGRQGHWGAACVEGFNAIMQGTPLFAAGGADGAVKDDKKWAEVWNSMRDSVQDTLKKAMKGELVGKWATLWNGLMREWGKGWETMGNEMRDNARVTIHELMKLVNDELADSVVDTLPDTHLHIGVTNTMIPSRLHPVSDSKFMTGLATATHSELQQYMLKLIREHGHIDMREAMVRIWRVVVELDGEGA